MRPQCRSDHHDLAKSGLEPKGTRSHKPRERKQTDAELRQESVRYRQGRRKLDPDLYVESVRAYEERQRQARNKAARLRRANRPKSFGPVVSERTTDNVGCQTSE